MPGMHEIDIRRYHAENYEELYQSFEWSIPERFNVGSAVCCRNAEKHGDAIAIHYYDGAGKYDEISFARMHESSNKLANYLKELGIKRGDVVGVCLPQRPELIQSWLAIYKLGCVALSMTPLFGTDAITYRLKHSEAKALIIEAERDDVRKAVRDINTLRHVILVDAGGGLGEKEREIEEASGASGSLDVADTGCDEPAHLFYTSGTTGPPKGALHAHRFLLGHIPCYQLYFEIAPREGDVFYTPADAGWIGAVGDLILPSLYFGYPVVLHRKVGRFEPEECLRLMERFKVTCAFIPPTALRMIRKTYPSPLEEFNLKIRAICSAGESVGRELILWGREKLNTPINEFYGCTEVNLIVVNCTTLMKTKPGALGKPSLGHVVDVIDAAGNRLGANETGYIAVKGPDPVMYLGYYKDPDATARKFIAGWFVLGDLGYKDEDGYFWFISRADDLIKTSAYRIGPDEVENVINQHPAVLESGVISKEDPMRGSIIKAFIVLRDGVKPEEKLKEEIKNFVKSRLAAYAYPREIEFVNQLPRTTTGKLQRYMLRKLERERG